jgi:hypothetical protein
MRRTRKKPIWEYRIYFTVIFEKDMFSKAWANAKTITPMIFS